VEYGLNEAIALYAIVPNAGGLNYTCNSHRDSLMFTSFPIPAHCQSLWDLQIYRSSIQGEILMLIQCWAVASLKVVTLLV